MNIKENAKAKIVLTRDKLLKTNVACSTIDEKQYHFEMLATSNKDKVKIQIYFGKNGVKSVLQGNSETNLYSQIYPIVFGEAEVKKIAEIIEPKEYIGSDESGKGDVFGPLITTAFFVDERAKVRLRQMGVRDSKELSEFQITEIATKIREEFPQNFETISLLPEKYNEIYPKFKNLNVLLIWTHSNAISNLLNKFPTKNVIVDKFSNRSLNITQNNSDNNIDILQITNGERFIGVAAASIIARDTFNKWFNKLKTEFYNFPKGASKEVEQIVKNLTKNNSLDELKKVTKIHFKTVQKYI
jgi:ribonuclease HIII